MNLYIWRYISHLLPKSEYRNFDGRNLFEYCLKKYSLHSNSVSFSKLGFSQWLRLMHYYWFYVSRLLILHKFFWFSYWVTMLLLVHVCVHVSVHVCSNSGYKKVDPKWTQATSRRNGNAPNLYMRGHKFECYAGRFNPIFVFCFFFPFYFSLVYIIAWVYTVFGYETDLKLN